MCKTSITTIFSFFFSSLFSTLKGISCCGKRFLDHKNNYTRSRHRNKDKTTGVYWVPRAWFKKVTVVKIFGNQTPAENLTRSTAAICHGHVRLLDQVKNLSKASGGFINVHLWTVWTCLSSPYLLLIPLMPFLVLLDMWKLGIMVVLPLPLPAAGKIFEKNGIKGKKRGILLLG